MVPVLSPQGQLMLRRGTMEIPTSAGLQKANAFGLYDMAGNVLEWTEDCWNDTYAGAPDDGTAWTTGDCDQLVQRGGSFLESLTDLSSTCRLGLDTDNRNYLNGFRVARTL